jgi:hypothetical protein
MQKTTTEAPRADRRPFGVYVNRIAGNDFDYRDVGRALDYDGALVD